MSSENKLSLQETQMDEFESSKVLELKPIHRNTLKFVKIGSLILGVLILIAGGIFVSVSLTKENDPTAKGSATPSSNAIVSATATPIPELQFPAEYQVMGDKVTKFDEEVLNTSETRTRLNPPTMNISASF